MLSSLSSAANVHLQSTLQNHAYWFFESISVTHLSAQTPYFLLFLYSATEFLNVTIDLCDFFNVFTQFFEHSAVNLFLFNTLTNDQ